MAKYFDEVVEELRNTGAIFGVEYIKKNFEATKMNGRFGVKKFSKGTGVSSPNVLTIWDNNRKRYTAMIPSRIQAITTKGVKYHKHGEFLVEDLYSSNQ